MWGSRRSQGVPVAYGVNPYIKDAFFGWVLYVFFDSSPRIPTEHEKYDGYTVRGMPNYIPLKRWNLKITQLKRKIMFQTSIFGVLNVNLYQGVPGGSL